MSSEQEILSYRELATDYRRRSLGALSDTVGWVVGMVAVEVSGLQIGSETSNEAGRLLVGGAAVTLCAGCVKKAWGTWQLRATLQDGYDEYKEFRRSDIVTPASET